MERRHVFAGLLVMTVLGLSLPAATPAATRDMRGTDFWLAYPSNIGTSVSLAVLIGGAEATSGTVSVPGLGSSTPFTVNPGVTTTVTVPAAAVLTTSNTVQNLGVHVTAGAEVTATAVNSYDAGGPPPDSLDSYLAAPTDALGSDFVVVGYRNTSTSFGTQFAVVAAQDGTAVTITPSVTTDGRTAGVPYTVTLDQGRAYQLRNTASASADLSGTRIQSSKPVVVIGGHQCGNVPVGADFCDHVAEEIPPTSEWGKEAVVAPLAGKAGGDVVRVVGSVDGTSLTWDPPLGGAPSSLDRGQVLELSAVTSAHVVRATAPILVAQYATGNQYGPGPYTGDPFEMLVPWTEQFPTSHVVSAPAGLAQDYVAILAPAGAVGSILLDGAAVGTGSFTAIGTSGWSYARRPVTAGLHVLSGSRPFGVQVYGLDPDSVSFGHVGELLRGAIAQLTTVAVSPATASLVPGTQHCVAATPRDGGSSALAGIGVSFAVSGANSASGYAVSQSDGAARFCYTGPNQGTDTITATTASGPSGTATATWAVPPPADGGGPAAPVPGPGPAVLPPAAAVRVAVASRGRVRVDRRRRYALVLTGTPGARGGRVSAVVLRGRRRLAAGATTFALGPGGTVRVRLRLPARTFRAVRSARRGLRTRITARLDRVTAVATIRLVARRPR